MVVLMPCSLEIDSEWTFQTSKLLSPCRSWIWSRAGNV